MGRSQKVKGYREERALVIELAKAGWTTKRVPYSGATKDDKGDVLAEKEGTKFRLEKKSRRGAFGSVYAAYTALKKEYGISLVTFSLSPDTGGVTCIDFTDNLDDFLPGLGFFPVHTVAASLKSWEQHGRAMKRLLTFRKWVQEADILVIRDNHKGHLFIRYR